MPERMNINDYRLPVLDVAMAVALATALLSAAPADPPENVAETLAEVRSALATLEQRRRAPGADTSTIDPRPIDNLVDTVWSALFDALSGLAALPADLYPRAAEATALLRAIFFGEQPRAFLRLRYAAEWSEVKARLDIIEAQKLAPRIEKLLGPDFLTEMHRTFDLYGAALGITTTVAISPTPESLLEPLRALTAALNDHVIAVLGMARRSKPGSREIAAAALEPIARLRRSPASPPPAVQPPQDDPSKPES